MNHRSVTFKADNISLSGWYIPSWKKDPPVVLIAHGLNANKENFLGAAQTIYLMGYDVFIFDFRAHGESGGHTVTFGIKESQDVKAAYDWIKREFPTRPCPEYLK